MKKIYISATFKDLEQERAAVEQALRKMGYVVVCMEDYVATDMRTDVKCTQDVATCDFFVGIIAWRYGWIPPGQGQSITELEYLQARSQPEKTRCLMFLLDENASWSRQWIDELTGETENASKLKAFRKSLDGQAVARFKDLDSLVREVMAAVRKEETIMWQQAVKRDFEQLLKQSRAVSVNAPEQIGSDAYKLFLTSSYTNEIVQALQVAINTATDAKLVDIDLRNQGGWWSTRLHLLAGLLELYTKVEKIVFSVNNHYVGIWSPAVIRQELAERTPRIELAFRQSLLDRPALDRAQEIPAIVSNFISNLDRIGGEMMLRVRQPAELVDVTPGLLQSFRGFNTDRVVVRPGENEIDHLSQIIRKPYPFVPLEFQDDFQVIDRVRLASGIAELATQYL